MEWMILPLKRYADFSGRSQRKEYWMFAILQTLLIVVPFFILGLSGSLDNSSPEPTGFALILFGVLGICFLGLIIPSLAVQVRRLHDTNRSGWWVLLGIIPIVSYIGFFVLLIFFCLDGTKGDNRYGADPKMEKNVGDVFS